MEGAKRIVETLRQQGYEAYIVGGAVRDHLLGRPIHDVDIATQATPSEVQRVFANHHVVGTGLQHGTVVVVSEGKNYEVTTYRIDQHTDGRHAQVAFAASLQEDVGRRDFTINAMALTSTGEVLDYVQGRQDLQQKLVRTVGDPHTRFTEDFLRMLRAVRFASQLGFAIEPNTYQAIVANAANITKISKERIQSEFLKIISSANASIGVELLRETTLLTYILPALNQTLETDTYLNNLDVLSHFIPLRLAFLYYNVPLKARLQDFDAIKLPNNYRSQVATLLATTGYPNAKDLPEVRRLVGNIDTLIYLWLDLQYARSTHSTREKLDRLKASINKVVYRADPTQISELAINGTDIISVLGVPEGPQVKQLLEQALELVLVHPEANQRNTLLGKLRGRV